MQIGFIFVGPVQHANNFGPEIKRRVKAQNWLAIKAGIENGHHAALSFHAFAVKLPAPVVCHDPSGGQGFALCAGEAHAVKRRGFFQVFEHGGGNLGFLERVAQKRGICLHQVLRAPELGVQPARGLDRGIFSINPVLLLYAVMILIRKTVKDRNHQTKQKHGENGAQNFQLLAHVR